MPPSRHLRKVAIAVVITPSLVIWTVMAVTCTRFVWSNFGPTEAVLPIIVGSFGILSMVGFLCYVWFVPQQTPSAPNTSRSSTNYYGLSANESQSRDQRNYSQRRHMNDVCAGNDEQYQRTDERRPVESRPSIMPMEERNNRDELRLPSYEEAVKYAVHQV